VTEIEHRLFVIALDWKDFFKNSLESLVFPLGKRDVFLKKINVRIGLNLN
jgi:hypothetical protein